MDLQFPQKYCGWPSKEHNDNRDLIDSDAVQQLGKKIWQIFQILMFYFQINSLFELVNVKADTMEDQLINY